MKYCLSMWESFLYETWIEPTKKSICSYYCLLPLYRKPAYPEKLLGALYRYSYRRGCGCSCCLLSARTDGNGKHQGGVFLLSRLPSSFSAVCLLLITWSEEKRLRLPVWGGLFLLTILAGLFVFLRGRNITGKSSSEAAISSVNPVAARELYLLFVITALFVLLCGFMAYISLGRLWLKGLILLFQISILVVYAVFRISFSKLGLALILFCLLLFMAETAACFINRGKKTAPVTLKKGLAFFFSPPSENLFSIDAGLPRRRPAPHPDPCRRKTGALGHAAFNCRRTGRKNKCPACPYQLYFFRKQGYLRPFFHWLQRRRQCGRQSFTRSLHPSFP